MNVYEIRQGEAFRMLVGKSPDEFEQFQVHPHGQAFGSAWRPAKFKYRGPSAEDYQGEVLNGDFVSVGFYTGLSPRAVAVLGPVFQRYGELLPLDVEGEPKEVMWFHCTNVVDALDEANSNVSRSPTTGKLYNINLHVFLKDRIPDDLLMFQLPYGKSAIYCTDTFKDIIERSGLTGLEFWLRWSDEPEGIERMRKWAAAHLRPRAAS